MSAASERLAIGVVGAGLIAQAVHLPALAALADRFAVRALADPSARRREALGAQYGIARRHAHWQALVEDDALDAVAICSPHGTHAEIALAALAAGRHVFVEKPLCIAPADADAICAAAAASGRVVQVGYMKRYDAGFELLCTGLAREPGRLRFVDVVTYDPGLARPPFAPRGIVAADDVPDAVARAGAAHERAQVEAAVGVGDPASVHAFATTYLAALIHDVNLVHGALDATGRSGRGRAVSSQHWADGRAARATVALDGAEWHCAWLLLPGLETFRETAAFYFDDAIHRLDLGAPYQREQPARHRVRRGRDGADVTTVASRAGDAYAAAWRHFHACVTAGEPCRTPPAQAREDVALLRDLFLARTRPGT